ncbi:MAG TPA: DUF2182 domain-containing protein [Actinomycetota bacterium]|nr:DUF2182 domain-containing protein [Actinomycetota bacterium]
MRARVPGLAPIRRISTSNEAPLWVVAAFAVVALGWHAGAPRGGALHHALEHGALMAAMMLPLAAPSAKVVAERSLRSRRSRTIVEHLAGFTAVWFVFGSAAALGVYELGGLVAPPWSFALVLVAAIAWQTSGSRRRFADRCGRVRVGPLRGWRCDVFTVTAGAAHAAGCLVTCGLAMTAMVAAPHVLVMAALYVAYLSEWVPGPNPFARDRVRRPVRAYAALALLTAGLALLG